MVAMTRSLHPEDLHHLVAEVVDHLDGDALTLRHRKRPRQALLSVAHTSASISALSVVLSAPYGSFWPKK
jgi:hypothetical protein